MKNKTDAELNFIIKDASEAAKNMQGMGDKKAEAKYLDQVNDASTELHRRKTKKTKVKEAAQFPFLKSLLEGLDGNYRTTTKKEMVLKDGMVMPAGAAVTCDFPNGSSYLLVNFQDRKLKLYYKNANSVLNGFQKEPSLAGLTKMMENGIATTPLGSRTEPDGTGKYGEPSWLLALGLI